MKRELVQGITIDDERTWDIDDAVWAEQREDNSILLWISIADVARAVRHGSEADVKAKERVATRYFATGNSPMLPRQLAEGELSLFPNEDRKTVTVEVTVSPDGEHTTRVFRSRLRSKQRLCYNEIPAILGDSKHELHTQVSLLARLSTVFLQGRRKRGALALYDLNNGWVTTEDGALKRMARREDTIGYVIVQEMMILANTTTATFAVENDIPFLYRNHVARAAAPPKEELMQQITEILHTQGEQLDALRERVHLLVGKADYAPTVRGHYGLALAAYTHTTSPIRRYADLVNQRQLRAFLRQEPYPHTQEDLDALGAHINGVLAEEKDSTAKHFKETHEDRARRAAQNAHRIDGLNAKQFERVVKVEARSGEEIGTAFDSAFRKRLADGRVPVVCSLVALVESPRDKSGWAALRETILRAYRQQPGDAVTLLAMATQTYKWSEPTYSAERSSAPNKPLIPLFVASAKVVVGEDAFVGTAEGATLKGARQRAAVLALAESQGVSMERFDVPEPKIRGWAMPEQKPDLPPLNPISALVERAQRLRHKHPEFEFDATGPDHARVAGCTCTMDGVTCRAEAGNKQAAKTEAAKLVLEALKAKGGSST